MTEQGVFSEVAVKGKKCDHKFFCYLLAYQEFRFCPDDSVCEEGDFLAHCCRWESGRHQEIEIQGISRSTIIPPTQEPIVKNPIFINSNGHVFSNLQSEIVKKITQMFKEIYRENN